MGAINISCLNVQRDSETGCAYDCGDSHNYQSCRQAYFLKKQAEIMATSNKQQITPTTNNEVLLKENADLKLELAQQISINNEMKSETSSHYQLSSLSIIIIIVISIIVGFLVNIFITRNH